MSESKAKIIGIAPTIVVKDVKKTAEYYRDVLGFQILNLVSDPPVYGMVERDSFEVHFGKSDSDAINTNESIRCESSEFVIWVPEIVAFYEELKSRNAEIVQDIVQRSYGREFIIRDCDGHKILVVD
jgi:catechol 2,3-dioxygenase-like lactoylglutathione lyase family enzyme